MLAETCYCVGLALAAVALVIAIHSFVLFKGQQSSFIYMLDNDALEPFRLTVILAAAALGWSVIYIIYEQTQATDIAFIDWERPQQVLIVR
jgi:hypothetical protein